MDVATRSEHPLSSAYPGLPPPVPTRLTVLPEHACPYLPGRQSISRAVYASSISPAAYHDFMDAGFRRSGRVIYQPICRGCRACVPIRVPVETFAPSKSQRRCWRRNQDLLVNVAAPEPSDEKFDLYCRYVRDWHGRDEPESRDDFESFLYESPLRDAAVDSGTIECEYRDPQSCALLAVGICDLCESRGSLSSVYFYFDPTAADRGLGTFGAVYEIELARRKNLSHYYLGFWVQACASMRYKSDFRPFETLDTDGVWRGRREVPVRATDERV